MVFDEDVFLWMRGQPSLLQTFGEGLISESGLVSDWPLLSTMTGVFRVYPIILPQSPIFPAATWSTELQDIAETFDGQGGLHTWELDVDCWGHTLTEAKQGARTIMGSLINLRGDVGNTCIHRTHLEGKVDQYEKAVDAYRSTIMFTMWCKDRS